MNLLIQFSDIGLRKNFQKTNNEVTILFFRTKVLKILRQ